MILRVILLLLLSVLAGCNGDEPDNTVYVAVEVLDAPAAVPANRDAWHTYRLRIADMQHQPDSILCRVRQPDGTELPPFRLYDDGGQTRIGTPVYADSVSGDIAAGNGTFTARINGQRLAAGVTGTYRFEFVPHGGGDIVWTGLSVLNVAVADVEQCIIQNWPDRFVFPQCFEPSVLELIISRSPADRIEAVWLDIIYSNMDFIPYGTEDFTPAAGDTVWRLILDPTAFRCLPRQLGPNPLEFRFKYIARTLFGDTCTAYSLRFTYFGMIPELTNSTLPDTIFRPVTPGDTDTITVTVDMEDCELAGATDYYGLRFEVRREDRQTWITGDDFYLRDDGVPPDAVAGDGHYTVGLTFTHDATAPNFLYYFQFYARDGFPPCLLESGQSPYLLDSVRVIQPGVLTGGNPANSAEPGFGVVVYP